MRISWTEKKSNEEEMEMAGYEKSLLKTISKNTTTVLWHTISVDGLENEILG